MTERDCLRDGVWKRINYYPVSVEKLKQASVEDLAYLIVPVNIGEDYEYFEQVKKFLDIPVKSKSLEEHSQELNEKIDKLIEDTKRKFYGSKIYAESKYERKFDKIFDNFEIAKNTGSFPQYLSVSASIGNGFVPTSCFVMDNSRLRFGENSVGFWSIQPNIQVHLEKKPNMIVRFFTKLLLNFEWKDK